MALHFVSVDDFIDHLPYYTHARVAANIEGARYLYHGKALLGFTWIAQWAVPYCHQMDYMQLDGSFKASYPYVYSTPQGVQSNEALPLGMSIHLSEDFLLFDYFQNDLQSVVPPGCPPLPGRPVLSDKGTAIAAFCRRHQFMQFLCHRNLIENAGANSPLGFIVARALRERSARSYQDHRPQYLADAEELHRVGLLSREQLLCFGNFLTPAFEHGIWHRIPWQMSTCSNHAERFHGVVNQHLQVRNSLPERLNVLRTEIMNRYECFGQGRHRQIQAVLEHLKSCNAPQSLTCSAPDCIEYKVLMSNRYGTTSFPCRHTAKVCGPPAYKPLPRPEMLAMPSDLHLMTEIVLDDPLPSKFLADSIVPDAPDSIPMNADELIGDGPKQMRPWEEDIALESGADPPNDRPGDWREAWERADRKIASDIVDGVLHFRRNRGQGEELVRSDVTLAVWADLRTSYKREGPEADRLQVAAQCAARWWVWAKEKGHARPFPPFGWSLPRDVPANAWGHS
jgi:hypothetical protein